MKKGYKITLWLVVGVLLVFFGYHLRDINLNNLYNNLLVTTDGKFNWTGIAAVLAIFGLIFNFWDSRRRVRADLVSKSRIAWMLEVRRQYSEYLTLSHTIAQDVRNLNKFSSLEYNSKKYLKIKGKMYDRQFELQNKYYFLKLYITEKSNEDLYGPIVDIHYILAKQINNVNKSSNPSTSEISDVRYPGSYTHKPSQIEIFELLNIAIDNASVFFKAEWEKAKSGK